MARYDLDAISPAQAQTARDLLVASVQQQYPNAQLGAGVLHDLVIELNALFAASVEQELVLNESISSIQGIIDLTQEQMEQLGVSQEQLDLRADLLAENYRVYRRSGVQASGQIEITLDSDYAAVVPSGSSFLYQGVEFVTQETFAARATQEELLLPTDRLLQPQGSNFRFLIDVVAKEVGSGGNLSSGVLLTTSLDLPGLVKICTFGTIAGGQDAESSQSMLLRTRESFATKTSSSRVGIAAIVEEVAGSNAKTSVIGASDAQMQRDRHGFFPVSSGGKIDVWVKTADYPDIQVLDIEATLISISGTVGTWQIDSSLNTAAPGFYDVIKVLLPNQTLDSAGFSPNLDQRSFDLAGDPVDITAGIEASFSKYQTAIIRFADTTTDASGLTPGDTASYRAVVRSLPKLQELQEKFLDPAIRPLSADILVRAAIPAFVSVSFELRIPAGSIEPDLNLIKAKVAGAINAQGFSDRLSASLVTATVLGLYPLARVDAISLSGTLRKANLSTAALSGTQTLLLTTDLPNYVSGKTAAFYCLSSDVTITLIEV